MYCTINLYNWAFTIQCIIISITQRWNNIDNVDDARFYTNWFENEPDVKEFDYSTRQNSPVSPLALKSCGSNPAFNCYTDNQGCTYDVITNTLDPSSLSTLVPVNGSGICTTSNCNVDVTPSLFLDFDLVRATTEEAEPACLGVYGANIAVATSSQYDVCQDLVGYRGIGASESETGGAKWIDLKCNQRSRCQICTIVGKQTFT